MPDSAGGPASEKSLKFELSPAGRRRAVVAALAIAAVAVAARLVQLQVIDTNRLAARANRQRSYTELLPARPGDILDRNGRVLATTITARSLFAVPQNISDRWAFSLQLGRALGLDPDQLYERLTADSDKKFAWIKRRLDPAEEETVRKLALPNGTWGLRDEYLRRYPQGTLAAHVLGLRDIDGTGRGGLEEMLQPVLCGREGRRTLLRDARGRVIDLLDEKDAPPERGTDAVVTLDSVIQSHVERQLDRLLGEFRPRGACAIVEDPATGEILAMASRPSFDLNQRDAVSPEQWLNRAVAWMYEPGSTLKPFVVAGALERRKIVRDESIDCSNGEAILGGRTLHDTHPYGDLSVMDVLVKSSNIGMARIGARLSNDQLRATLMAFGFGRSTCCGLPGEMAGLLHPLKRWTSYSNPSLSMGQELAVTPLQLIAAHGALANGGMWTAPRLVLSIGEGDGRGAGRSCVPTPVVSRATDYDVARWLIEEPMTAVVERGTGKRAKLDGYSVFGKTGTAQKLDPDTRSYSATRTVSSFLCGAPSSSPRVLVLVVVDEPSIGESHYGGAVAAPAAAEILRQSLLALQVRPGVPAGRAVDRQASARPSADARAHSAGASENQ